MLNCDEFVCANPLASKVKKCKICALYFVLRNLPRKKRSMLSSIVKQFCVKKFSLRNMAMNLFKLGFNKI